MTKKYFFIFLTLLCISFASVGLHGCGGLVTFKNLFSKWTNTADSTLVYDLTDGKFSTEFTLAITGNCFATIYIDGDQRSGTMEWRGGTPAGSDCDEWNGLTMDYSNDGYTLTLTLPSIGKTYFR
jgi:hypothetical protein